MPDGGAITREFAVDTSFADLRLFISDELRGRGLTDFDLVHSFSRRQFQTGDLTSTLAELDLAGPNALIVVPRRNGGGGSGANKDDDAFSIVALFWLVLTPFVFIVNLLRDLIFGAPTTRSVVGAPTSAGPVSANDGSAVDRLDFLSAWVLFCSCFCCF